MSTLDCGLDMHTYTQLYTVTVKNKHVNSCNAQTQGLLYVPHTLYHTAYMYFCWKLFGSLFLLIEGMKHAYGVSHPPQRLCYYEWHGGMKFAPVGTSTCTWIHTAFDSESMYIVGRAGASPPCHCAGALLYRFIYIYIYICHRRCHLLVPTGPRATGKRKASSITSGYLGKRAKRAS